MAASVADICFLFWCFLVSNFCGFEGVYAIDSENEGRWDIYTCTELINFSLLSWNFVLKQFILPTIGQCMPMWYDSKAGVEGAVYIYFVYVFILLFFIFGVLVMIK